MRFVYGNNTVIIVGGDYPATRPYNLSQVVDRTAAGTLQTEDLGVDIETREIVFNLMSKEDHDSLYNFFVNIVVGVKNEFEFEDEVGRIGIVKFIDSEWNFQETSFQIYSGTKVIEYLQ